MKNPEITELIVHSLDSDADPAEACRKLLDKGVLYTFSEGFVDRVLKAIMKTGSLVREEIEIAASIQNIFYRIAFAGAAAIFLLYVSIVFAEGSFSLNSLLGLSNNYDESIICLLTGK